MKLSRVFLILFLIALAAGIGTLILNATAIVLALWLELVAAASFIVAGSCLPAAICATTLEQGRLRGLMWSGIACAVAAAAGWVAAYVYVASTWNDIQPIVNLIMLPTMWALVCMMSALLFGHRRQGALAAGVGKFAWLASMATIALLGMMIWTRGEIFSTGFEKLFLACMVVAAFGTMLALVLQRLPQLSGISETDARVVRMPLRVWCPRCANEQEIQTGGAHCAHCGLSISVKVP